MDDKSAMNKLLIILGLAIVSLATVATTAIVLLISDKDITKTYQPHPYNECIKLLIDQGNKEDKGCDFDKIKSVCFELMKDKEMLK